MRCTTLATLAIVVAMASQVMAQEQIASPLPAEPVPVALPNTPAEAVPPAPPCAESSETGPCQRFRLRGEYLWWWFKDMPLPPVLTMGDVTDPLPGALGMPSTVVLYGGQDIDQKKLSGARFIASVWLDDAEEFGLEAIGLFLSSRTVHTPRFSNGGLNDPVLGRPFFNLATGQQDVSLIAYPTLAAGQFQIGVTTRMAGVEANGLANLYRYRGFRIDLLAGFRYFQMYEAVTIGEHSSVAQGVPLVGGWDISGVDDFSVRNHFDGGQLGLRSELHNGRLWLEVQGKLALGNTQEVLQIDGQTRLTQPGQPTQVFPGDLYALSSNIGRHVHNSFALLPEANVNLGWQILDHLSLQVGYSFLYLSRLARPGEQIDQALNPNLIPTSISYGLPGGPMRPAPVIRETDFWVQGLNAGLEFIF